MTIHLKANPKTKVVWFDRPSDCICFADRLDVLCKEGEPIPQAAIIKIPLSDGEDFIEALMNSSRKEENYWKIVDGIQFVLDKKAADSIQLSERLRLEWSKESGGGIVRRNNNEIVVRADEVIKLRELRDKVREILDGYEKNNAPMDPGTRIFELKKWIEESGLDEYRELPQPKDTAGGEGEGENPSKHPDQPGSGESGSPPSGR